MLVHPCPVAITSTTIPEVARASGRLIQEHLRLTADQAHLSSLIANSSHLAHPRHPGTTLLFNPCSFTSDLLLQQHGCESMDCLGTSGELCITAFP